MKDALPQTIYLKDYEESNFLVESIDLDFHIFKEKTVVYSQTNFYANKGNTNNTLTLDGESLKLIEIKIDGKALCDNQYKVFDEKLEVYEVPDKFKLEIEVEIDPVTNKALEGLYQSGDIYCTQNEAQGFRKITYYLDRPDIMAKFTTRIEADKKTFPNLLSNGNRISQGDLKDGRHFTCWEDPFLKPCYLYALVAGDLALVKDKFKTASGRDVDLEIYVDKGNEDKCGWAMRSLQKSMQWDEARFGLEYDLDLYMIVAVDAFNMGAMENKGLNIFNSHYVLAKQETATDSDFIGIESVIGHEYFHNWTGNRVTCRDWFQLTLKEGLTVYRDQEFTADLNSRGVKRIEDVAMLRGRQFPEDAGPMSHPIRPTSYIEINNFYTSTVYEKGAEVIRMIATILGTHKFRKGMDLYFKRHDGQAVTTEDFVSAMSDASGVDLEQFKNWYAQNGTPTVEVKTQYDKDKKQFSINLKQNLPFDQSALLHIPLEYGLMSLQGEDLTSNPQCKGVIQFKKKHQTIVLSDINEAPLLSINRGYSAPVNIDYDYTQSQLSTLLAYDKDEFNRWDAGQKLYLMQIRKMIGDGSQEVGEEFLNAFKNLLVDSSIDNAFKAFALTLPSESEINDSLTEPDYEGVHNCREGLLNKLAVKNEEIIFEMYQALRKNTKFELSAPAMGDRALSNKLLGLLFRSDKYREVAYEQFHKASNMTDEIGALSLIVNETTHQSTQASQIFFDKWQSDFLVLNKWFGVCAGAHRDDIDKVILALESNPKFDNKNPNMLRALYGGFARNLVSFNRADGSGYELLSQKIKEIDEFNPQIAARFCGVFNRYQKLPKNLKSKMHASLESILSKKQLSKDVFEIVSRTLGK